MASELQDPIDEAWNEVAAATADLPEEPATVAPGELVDSDGYPTEEALEHLERFTGTPAEYVAFAESLFVNGAGVQVEDLDDRWNHGMKRVSFVTGGWSGCESVISVIEGSMFSFRFAREWRSGGYWAYEIHSSQWDNSPSFLGKMWILAEEKHPDRGMYPERLHTVDTGQLRHIIDLIDSNQTLLARHRLVELTKKAEQA